MSSASLKPGILLGAYPERQTKTPDWLEKYSARLSQFWCRHIIYSPSTLKRVIQQIYQQAIQIQKLDDKQLSLKVTGLRQQLHQHGLIPDLLTQAFAVIQEQSGRVLKQRHYDVQLIGGWIMVNGLLAEMQTGEGKTLTATLPAATAAMAGIPVHIMTANDYLVQRDANKLRPLYEALGLTVGYVTQDMNPDSRRQAYHCDITYGTGKQFAFDYLRDRLLLAKKPSRLQLQLEELHSAAPTNKRLLLRGLCFAIVDEADSILIDEARTPLLIAQQVNNAETQNQLQIQALAVASRLEEGIHFDLDLANRRIALLPKSLAVLNELTPDMNPVWSGQQRRQEAVTQALTAIHLFHRDRQYLVKNNQVQIIDETTGRLMPDRAWERGLQQMIETKEGCVATAQNETLARMSFQRFFRRYIKLSGMTGTASEVASELSAVYALPTIVVPTRLPCKRRCLGKKVFINGINRWQAVLNTARVMHKKNRPLLLATRSVVASEHLSKLLEEAQLKHQILNARQDLHEAEIIAQAGEAACITIATNMAGRGTDIILSDLALKAGGLHVIATEHNESPRIDRQLFGRAARQGDPGSYQSFCALDDELFLSFLPSWLMQLARYYPAKKQTAQALPNWLGAILIQTAQNQAARLSWHERNDLLQLDQRIANALAFAGQAE